MRPEFLLPVLLLLLVLAVLLLRRERAKKAAAAGAPVETPAAPATASQAPPAPAPIASANAEALFTIQVWELGIVLLGLFLLLAHVAVGAPPLAGGLVVALAGALAVVVRTRRGARG